MSNACLECGGQCCKAIDVPVLPSEWRSLPGIVKTGRRGSLAMVYRALGPLGRRCPLQDDDGRCRLHGKASQPAICRWTAVGSRACNAARARSELPLVPMAPLGWAKHVVLAVVEVFGRRCEPKGYAYALSEEWAWMVASSLYRLGVFSEEEWLLYQNGHNSPPTKSEKTKDPAWGPSPLAALLSPLKAARIVDETLGVKL